ncbi:unnamed protein product [Rotaria socialis]|uniref:Protein kinase domain-containing protein n=1 Tax=Rotaria socialis TaxID=392032 RepID=A0A818B8B4_9BILA|nr:unnamed protein product [Rotaria socialis]CAF4112237.1 unnamed protein product [Rotaria socialis]
MALASTTASNDVLPKPQNESLTSGLNNMKQVIESNRHIKSTIQRITNNFMCMYMDFQDSLAKLPSKESITEVYTEPIESLDFKFLNNHQTHDRIQLALCGPNSSGKTTFLQSFVGIGNILPIDVGPVSARIVKLAYAAPLDACLVVHSSIQDSYTENDKEKHTLPLSEYFDDSATDWKGIAKAIEGYVARPKENTHEFNEWAKQFLEIRIPSPILELDIDAYDTPGLLFHDEPVLKENLKELVRLVRPVIVFLYANATFAKDANECYLMIRSTIDDSEQPPIFYLNTRQDISTLFNGAGFISNRKNQKYFTVEKYHEIFPSERLKRYQELYNNVGTSNKLPMIEDSEIFDKKCDNFDICSIVSCSLLPDCALEMTKQACQRIIEYAVKAEMEKPLEMANQVLDKIDSIFNFIASASHRTEEQWKDIRLNAEKWGEHFFQNFQNELSPVAEKVQEKILQRFDQHSTDIIERAVKLERSDDPLHCKTRDVVKTNIKDFIKIAIQEEVIKFAVNETVNESKENIRTTIKNAILINVEKNELLTVAQRHVLMDVSSDSITQRGLVENMLYQLSLAPSVLLRLVRGFSAVAYQDHWNTLNTTVLKAKEKFYVMMDAMDSFSVLNNESKRREFAKEYLKRRRSKIDAEKELYKNNLQLWIANKEKMFKNNIKSNYKLAISHLNIRDSAYQSTMSYIRCFTEFECELAALKDLAKFKAHHPVIDESQKLGSGAHFDIYPAEWGNKKNLAVKKLKQSSNQYGYLQYLEAHNHRKITKLSQITDSEGDSESLKLRIQHIAPLLYLYKQQETEDQNKLCMVLERYSQSLDKYLEKKISTIKADEVLKIALDMIDVLVFLHANDIVHRDIKSQNILMDEKNQCYLADFGTAREWTTNSTVIGTFPLPPECMSGSVYDGRVADAYSFGIFLFELLPKNTYIRPDNCTVIKTMLKTTAQLNEYNRTYEELIESCLQSVPESRPSAIIIQSTLLQCLKDAEKKPCMTCEDNLRKCRFQPCKHKLVCESCFGKLSKNTEGKSNCILCWKTIDQWTEDENNDTYFG